LVIVLELTVKNVMAIEVELLNVAPVPEKVMVWLPRVRVFPPLKVPVLPKAESMPIAREADVAAENVRVSLPEPNPK